MRDEKREVFIKLEATGLLQTLTVVSKGNEENPLEFYYREIGCDYIDIVNPVGLPDGYCMIVDDEGLLKKDPVVNLVASVLYGADKHGQVIAGTALIGKEEEMEDGVITTGLEREDMEILIPILMQAVNSINIDK